MTKSDAVSAAKAVRMRICQYRGRSVGVWLDGTLVRCAVVAGQAWRAMENSPHVVGVYNKMSDVETIAGDILLAANGEYA